MDVVWGFFRGDYLDELQSNYKIDKADIELLRAVGATTLQSLDSILKEYPEILIHPNELSYAHTLEMNKVPFSTILLDPLDYSKLESSFEDINFGSTIPSDAIHGLGYTYSREEALIDYYARISMPPVATQSLNGHHTSHGFPISNHTGSTWRVKNQGDRGTCVSFSVVALMEGGPGPQLSEQFLQWHLKKHGTDSNKFTEGSRILYALQSAKSGGICESDQCPYNPKPILNNPSQDGTIYAPSLKAIADAQKIAGRSYIHDFTHHLTSGKARLLINALKQYGAVAISLPVFATPRGTTNWTFRTGPAYGLVTNALPNARVAGAHAVCITAFEIDSSEALGGHFIIRNSWGENWGRSLPEAGFFGPEPGYGQVSASHVDKFLYEYGAFT
ncbi:C1 family peptidase [Xanthomonas arboricola pv. pruni]|uniref:C1 family peptidase n=1 Tax=Xanthomonas arboricola TaxID=56448 RepID=UPI001CC4CC6B|nr:C1 family peptidase [Xanthomonas arboricola]MDN0267216.1 C1 family peptidase [Xanthomonas arboricola pv. pruni]MDN0282064.1 C1 family peptidase [Xanthomonas arboricola pv. pruni]UJO07261.1 C1 family peptidase [Xanthomonas arboricola pv. pruni]